MAIDFVTFPIKHGDFPISYVKLPPGILHQAPTLGIRPGQDTRVILVLLATEVEFMFALTRGRKSMREIPGEIADKNGGFNGKIMENNYIGKSTFCLFLVI